jgi:hypothetical protein
MRAIFKAVWSLGFMVIAATSAQAQRFDGVDWAVPAGLKLADNWTTACPLRCTVYEGTEPTFEDQWPLLIVHEPATSADKFLAAWSASHFSEDEFVPQIIQRDTSDIGGGLKMTMILANTEEIDPDRPSRASVSVLMMLDNQGVVLPLEIAAFSRDDLALRMNAATELISSAKINPVAAKGAIGKTDAANAAATKAIATGYGRGERLQLYMSSQIQIGNTWGMSGLEMTSTRVSTIYAVLPGGVLLTSIPDSFRMPSIALARSNGTLGSWTKTAAGVDVVMPDGKRKSLRVAGDQLIADDGSHGLIPVLSVKQLAGRYETTTVSSTGGMAVGNPTMTASRADSGLVLGADGRFTQSRDSSTMVSGPNIGGGVGNSETQSGRWTYDGAALMLTLVPDGGEPARSGPFFCYGCDADKITSENWDWNVLGGEEWWRANKEN